MAVEFRSREWIADGTRIQALIKFLRNLRPEGCCLAAADDLVDELYTSRTSSSISLHGHQSEKTYLTCEGCPLMLYIRIHRRVGNMRVLRDQEIESWRQRILGAVRSSSDFRGCIFVLWGTDYADQPIQNARKLAKALPEYQFDWKSHAVSTGTIAALFSPKNTCTHYDNVATCVNPDPGSSSNYLKVNVANNKRLTEQVNTDDENWLQCTPHDEPKSWEDFGNEIPSLSQKRLRYGIA